VVDIDVVRRYIDRLCTVWKWLNVVNSGTTGLGTVVAPLPH